MGRYPEEIGELLEDALQAAEERRYAHLTPEQLRRRLARAEDGRRALGNVFVVALIFCYVLVFRKELITALERLGRLTGDG